MWHLFVKTRLGYVERSSCAPTTLQGVILRAVKSTDYKSIREQFRRTLFNEILLERAWQMEFYKALYLSTPNNCITSADVGDVFESRGVIDLTLYYGDLFWGIELLREGDRLDEHIRRFALDGPYSRLQLTDYCLLDFQRVPRAAQIAITTGSENPFIVSYDEGLHNVSMSHGEESWIIRLAASSD
ncbi:unnamed protein product [Phytophthora lilii]|uniref:Unnamed protein product n=1 Tax=Phytophthora lilii TaxID=2077276 RepID=A0A9W6WPE4_9STRA|nr:unnamed protein product [Phytophthora lilii]